MAEKKRPAEFPTDWHWEAHHEALLRELAGRQSRLAELEATPAAEEHVLEQTRQEIAAVEAQLEHYGWGQRAASKRPKEAPAKRSAPPAAESKQKR